ncbi:hypothetical protein OPV22_018303 [Ensete ventricosum]|uniref:Uncharacterized protein n=1 Tax=Ensete ventricosum TaxID=4639 RepID=A0AAV8QZ85_ENSVE|nr:hypothetical protein OPV22_018303 [Ensete ventricosum]
MTSGLRWILIQRPIEADVYFVGYAYPVTTHWLIHPLFACADADSATATSCDHLRPPSPHSGHPCRFHPHGVDAKQRWAGTCRGRRFPRERGARVAVAVTRVLGWRPTANPKVGGPLSLPALSQADPPHTDPTFPTADHISTPLRQRGSHKHS